MAFLIGLCSQFILPSYSGPPTYHVSRFINRYAFSYIALYGTAYIPAAKKTWTQASLVPSWPSSPTDFEQHDEGPGHRRPRKRLPHRPRPYHGLHLRRLPHHFARLSLPRIHKTSLQQRGEIHARRHGLCVSHRPAGLPDFHDAHWEWCGVSISPCRAYGSNC